MKKILFSLSVISLIAAGCTFNQQPAQPDSSQTSNETTFQAKLDTTNWEKFSNGALEFRYPKDWKVEASQKDTTTTLSFSNKQKQYMAEGSIIAPIIFTYRHDTYSGNVNNYITNESVRNLIKKETVRIDGKVTYVIEGVTPPVYQNSRITFANNLVFNFSNNSKNIGNTTVEQQQIDNVFNTILSSVKFK